MSPKLLSMNVRWYLMLLCWLSHLSIIIRADNPVSQMIQAEYWKSNPKFPEVPIETPEPIAKEAYAYLFCSRPMIDHSQTYFDALKVAVYRLQVVNKYYDPNPKDIIVVVCSYTPEWQIDVIKSLGVILVSVDPIIPTGRLADNPYYVDQFTKLQLWRLAKWERLFYLDIDTTVTKDFISVWDEPAAQIKTEPKDPKDADYYPYLFTAVEDLAQRRRRCRNCYFNAGVFMIMPSMAYFKRLIKDMNTNSGNRDFMEQDYFNLVFRTSGPVPCSRLPPIYNHFIEFSDEYEVGTKILHCKIWEKNNKQTRKYHDGWWDDFSHLFKSQPLDLQRVYDIDDVFLLNSTNKEAYVFLLNINHQSANDYFMIFQALKMSITHIQKYQKDVEVGRDIIVITIEEIPSWHLQELQNIGALVIRARHERKGKANWSDDYLRIVLWKLVHWDRLLYIDNDIFIHNKDFLNIWNEESTQIITQQKQNYKLPLYNVPDEKVKGFYPYVFSAALDSNNAHFNSGMFMFKPSIRHHEYLMSLFNDGVAEGKQGLLNYAYSQDSPMPSTTLDQSYNTLSLSKEAVVNEIKAVNGKLWTRLDEKNSNPFINKFWDSFNKFSIELDTNKIFGGNSRPANCEEGTSPTRCKSCADGNNYVDYDKASYMLCPSGIPFGTTLDWFEFSDQCTSLSDECVSCIKDGKCSSCKLGLLFHEYCVISSTISSDIVGYCSPSTENGMSYIAKGSICLPKLTAAKILKRIVLSAMLVIIMLMALFLARYFVMRVVKRFRKKQYAKMEEHELESNKNPDEIETFGNSSPFQDENKA